MSKVYEAIKRLERERDQRTRRDLLATRVVDGRPDDLPDPASEEYRRLRASLLLSGGGAELHTILVASARHGDGASRVAVGLASSLASDQGNRVLLIEANLRSPSLGRLIATNSAPGVSDYLVGRAGPDSLVQRVEDLNLSIVHAGAAPAKIDCEAMATLIGELSAQFDYTVVDVSPVNRYADASVLASRVDGVILVVEADRTPVVDAETAKRNLDKVGARVLGVVLNRRRSYVPELLQGLL